MKKIVISLIIAFTAMTAFAQTQRNAIPAVSPDNNVVYRLFPTENRWTFIKLNTRTGQLWQVQFSIDGDNYRFTTTLCLRARASVEEEKNGRFFLYPTQNMFNFILLDQVDGRVWQVQWSTRRDERFVIPIR